MKAVIHTCDDPSLLLACLEREDVFRFFFTRGTFLPVTFKLESSSAEISNKEFKDKTILCNQECQSSEYQSFYADMEALDSDDYYTGIPNIHQKLPNALIPKGSPQEPPESEG